MFLEAVKVVGGLYIVISVVCLIAGLFYLLFKKAIRQDNGLLNGIFGIVCVGSGIVVLFTLPYVLKERAKVVYKESPTWFYFFISSVVIIGLWIYEAREVKKEKLGLKNNQVEDKFGDYW